MSEFIKSKFIYLVLVILGLLILIFVSFEAGLVIGVRKERHFSGWSQQYGMMMNTDRRLGPGGRMPPFPSQMFPAGQGVFGKVISASGASLVVTGKDGIEQNVLMTTSTVIRVGRDTGSLKDLQVDDDVAVFGSPNDQGQIDAHLVRILSATSSVDAR